jgi:hypothetical protein
VLFELKAMLRRRRASTAFHPSGAWEVLPADPRIFALRRTSPDAAEAMLCLHNVSGETVRAGDRELEPYQVLWLPER